MKKEKEEKKNRKTLRGTVAATKMQDTTIVAVDRYIKHPIYGKYRRVTKRYKVHAPGSTVKEGDTVVIEACRPIAKGKYFRILPNSV